MDVLQKWNRSIPDGNGTAAAILFFFTVYIFKTILFIPFRGMEAADVCLFASFYAVMRLCDKKTGTSFSAEDRMAVLCVSGICFDD